MAKIKRTKKNEEKEIVIWIKLSGETYRDYFKRIIRQISWGFIITFLLTVPGTIVACLVLSDRCSSEPESEIIINEILRDSVNQNVDAIEATFHPEEIPGNIDTVANRDIMLIKQFKMYSLEFSNNVRELYNTPRVTDYKDKKLDEIVTLGKNWDEKRHACKEVSKKLFDVIKKLDTYGKEHQINNYIINLSVYQAILDSQEESDNYSDKLKDQALEIHNIAMFNRGESVKYYSEDNKDVLIKIISLQEESWDNEIVHRCENRILMFIINQNKNYDVVLKKFLSETSNR